MIDGNFENLLYIPLAFACWLTPVIGIIYAWTGLFSPRASEAELQDWKDNDRSVADLSEYGYEDPFKGTNPKATSAE